jgi:beta-lactamase superfamily II metal-dependent hydrolase
MDKTTIYVRMYKGLLGDCFLIRCITDKAASHILIDCGVLQGTEGGTELMQAVAADIVAATGGSLEQGIAGKLDLLVVTHEHWDHISGFAHARDIFFDSKKLKIDNIWFGWTERPGDEQADRLRKRFAKRNKTIAMIAKDLAAEVAGSGAFAAAPRMALDNLQNFIGVEAGNVLSEIVIKEEGEPPDAQTKTNSVPKGRMTGARIIDALRSHVGGKDGKEGKAEYAEPGAKWRTPGDVPLDVHVLGPPRDEAFLFKALATGDDGNAHFDALAFNDKLLFGLSGVLDGDDDPNPADFDPAAQSPFSKRHRAFRAAEVEGELDPAPPSGTAPSSPAETRSWLRSRYYDLKPPCRFGMSPPQWHICEHDMVCYSNQQSKRIDGDWLAVAGSLALKLDSDTNNTSLVLAFELPNKEVMLFAADAQIGNWESWAKREYDGNTLDALLSRVSFYKVGHHGSHNATLIKDGVEKMGSVTQNGLVAMIPTDEVFASQQGRSGKGWKMPHPSVRDPLLARTRGRVLYGDRKWGEFPPKTKNGTGERDPRFASFPSDPDFDDRLDQDESLYVEYRVFGPKRDWPIQAKEQPA